MKTNSKFKIVYVFAIFVMTIAFNSCTKESSISPDENTTTDEGSKHGSNCNSMVFPSNAHVNGSTYAEWSAKWWKWSMEFPLAGHPFVDDASFSVSNRQSGNVWFLATPFGNVVRNCNIPHGVKLFVGLLNAEASDLEGLGNNAADQLANAKFNADHIRNLHVTIDGKILNDVNDYRFASPQLSFVAPTPGIFGATGGNGTSVGDGYYMMIKDLKKGNHVLHYTGDFHFAIAEGDPFDYDAGLDMTYNLSVH